MCLHKAEAQKNDTAAMTTASVKSVLGNYIENVILCGGENSVVCVGGGEGDNQIFDF